MVKLNGQLKLKEEIFRKVGKYYKLFLDNEIMGVPVSGKVYDEKELIAIVSAALDGWWTEGSVTQEFEEKFSKFLGVKHTIVVNSGSSANLLALKTLFSAKLKNRRLKEGDEVITVAVGFPTTINPIIQCNLVPVFCDVDLKTYVINIKQLKSAISKKTKVVFLSHTLGNPFNVDEVKRLCKKHNLWLIEDNCDSLGSEYKGKLTGTFGDISTHSFYPAHHITMGEGGALCVHNSELAKIAKSIRDWGKDCWCRTGKDNFCMKRFDWKLGKLPHGYDHKYIYSEIGYNLKNTDLNVAIGLAQMEKLNSFIRQRRNNFLLLREKLLKFQKYFILPEATKNSNPSWFGFLITLKKDCPFPRTELLRYLTKNKIGTRLLFAGNIIKQPYFVENKIKYRTVGSLGNTDFIMENTFWIGVYPGINKKHIDYIEKTLENFLKERK
ncbi:MAG: lipopolysaccharide biosynthesis protein RfbH [Candidatus Gracilibacteria bacterium]|jgi:CDP-6-deoxy-D-xylo-4-hexulose-3-dehydrase